MECDLNIAQTKALGFKLLPCGGEAEAFMGYEKGSPTTGGLAFSSELRNSGALALFVPCGEEGKGRNDTY